ncbi:MAG: AMP phosphorylase [Candidatus Aenigmarchaeota archaeon]|nr:AMP phosphorylase [Candidatus Aenigmarchaeota archaeon]
MLLKVKKLDLTAGGKPIVVINKADLEELGSKIPPRVKIRYKEKNFIAIPNVSEEIVKKGEIGIYHELFKIIGAKSGEEVSVEIASYPESLNFIKKKLRGKKLEYEEFYEIVKDVLEEKLTEGEITGFVVGLHAYGLSLEEAAALSKAMVETGERLNLGEKIVLDKHSIGGGIGDKTSILLVPIIASLGYKIPKTSSRAITSPAGTADKVETLMRVNLNIEEMRSVVKKTNGCLVWGGSLHLAPADDIFIKIEYPLEIDPLLFPSIMAKKMAVGANKLVIDIPTGRGAKIKTIGDAQILAKDFIKLGGYLGIETRVAITHGEQPIGYSVGAGLEAREALEILMGLKNVEDQIDKVTSIASILLEMVGVEDGKRIALEVLKSGKAERKLREIIAEQGGNPHVKPEDIPFGRFTYDFISETDGNILWIDSGGIGSVARAAGSPTDKGAGVYLYKKVGDSVKKGEKILTIFSNSEAKLERAIKILNEEAVVGYGGRRKMLIGKVCEGEIEKKRFILDR